MLIHPWDAPLDDDEWLAWLASVEPFGQLVVADTPWPHIVPLHFAARPDGRSIVTHLARPNPVWPALEAGGTAVLALAADVAYIPSTWREVGEAPGVPTSYYTAVQLLCMTEIVDDPAGKAAILTEQMACMEPASEHSVISAESGPYIRMLTGIRGLILHVQDVHAKFKFDDHKPVAFRERVTSALLSRAHPGDEAAARQQVRRGRVDRHHTEPDDD